MDPFRFLLSELALFYTYGLILAWAFERQAPPSGARKLLDLGRGAENNQLP